MKVIYRAFDGTEFDTATDCIIYEDKMSKETFVLYNNCGFITEESNAAFIIHIKSKNIETGISAIENCFKSQGSSCRGLNPVNEARWYFWNPTFDEYYSLPEYVVDAFRNIVGEE